MSDLSRFRRARGDDGASAVEFALLFPLFVMLVIGTISAGFAFNAWLSVTHGAQESSRFAATLSLDAGGGTMADWLNQVADRAYAASNLNVDSTHVKPGTKLCVAVIAPTNLPTGMNNHLVITADASGTKVPTPGVGPCPGLPTMTGEYVQVSVSQPANFNYVVASSQIDVADTSISRYEAVSFS